MPRSEVAEEKNILTKDSQEKLMSQVTALRQRSRSMLHSGEQVTVHRTGLGEEDPGTWGDPRSRFSLEFRQHDHLLVIGDELAPIAQQLRPAFLAATHRVEVVGNGLEALQQVRTSAPDVILLDLGLAEPCGLRMHQEIRGIAPDIPVIAVTKTTRGDVAIEAMKQGAYDCLFQPLDVRELRRVVEEALEVVRQKEQPAAAEEIFPEADLDSGIVGCSPPMGDVYKAIGRVAAQPVPVLITGESGTGKELVARAICRHGPRSHMPFVALNCAAIPENLLESELFGHEKGAFTGADRRRIGKFEQANGGTLFLDEIGDMPLALQAKILRLLQEQAFERVGGNETIRTDVRLIAATHRDLKAWSAQGKFRADLFYRIGVFSVHLPPLRERGTDLPLLVRHYLRQFSRELGREVRQIAPEAMALLCRYSWPGNIRELQSVLKQALVHASGTMLLPAFLPPDLGGVRSAVPVDAVAEARDKETFIIHQQVASGMRDLYAETHREIDRLLLPRVLELTRGNQQQAALMLGIARQTLRTKLRDLGLKTSDE
jgi:two-component system nitrogen regulation response regulator GlnG